MLISKIVHTREMMQTWDNYKLVEKNKCSQHHFKCTSLSQTMNHGAKSNCMEVVSSTYSCTCSSAKTRARCVTFWESSLLLPCIFCGMSQRIRSHFLLSQRSGININCRTTSKMPNSKQKFCKHENNCTSNTEQSEQCILRYLCLKKDLYYFAS